MGAGPLSLIRDANNAKWQLWKASHGEPGAIDFLTPTMSTALAAANTYQDLSRVSFRGSASGYAENNNLKAVLRGEVCTSSRAGLQGRTYTKLTRLHSPHEVDFCNSVVSDLIYNTLGQQSHRAASMMARVVGELHDNVASHASGAGFSCAQYYGQQRGKPATAIFSIADSGCGMLSNVRKVSGVIQQEIDAIRWCLQRGNTTAKANDPWAQRLPEDAMESPFPSSVPTYSNENHHVGLGLWRLSELVREFSGALWILSGSRDGCAEYWYNQHSVRAASVDLPWRGVAVSFQLTVPGEEFAATVDVASLEALGKRLGL